MKEIVLDGHRICYREEGQGDPVLLVHGWTGSSYDWIKFIPLLAERHRVVCPDQIGYGTSDKPRIAYRLDLYVSHLAKLADALGLDRFHLVGNSMGGHISAAFALAHPDRLRSLTLLDAAGVKEGAPGIFRFGRFPRFIAFLLRATSLRAYNFIYRRFGPYYDSTFLTPKDVRGHYHSYGNPEGAYAAAQCLRHILLEPGAQLDARLKDIRTPTLIVWGQQDPLLPRRMSNVFLREIPGAKRVYIESCGHCAQEEKPEALRQILEPFFQDPLQFPELLPNAPGEYFVH